MLDARWIIFLALVMYYRTVILKLANIEYSKFSRIYDKYDIDDNMNKRNAAISSFSTTSKNTVTVFLTNKGVILSILFLMYFMLYLKHFF